MFKDWPFSSCRGTHRAKVGTCTYTQRILLGSTKISVVFCMVTTIRNEQASGRLWKSLENRGNCH